MSYDPDPRRRRRARRRRYYDPAPARRIRISGRSVRGIAAAILAGIGLGFVADRLVRNFGVQLGGLEGFIAPASALAGGYYYGRAGGALGALLGHIILTGLPNFWGTQKTQTVGESI